MSRSRQLLLVYLDLLFALFAGVFLLSLALSINRGRTPHKLVKDFVIVRVFWKDSAVPKKSWAEGVMPPLVVNVQRDWSFVHATGDHPTSQATITEQRVSVFCKSPARAGRWRFDIPEWEDVDRIEYMTRRTSGKFDPSRNGTILVIETEGD